MRNPKFFFSKTFFDTLVAIIRLMSPINCCSKDDFWLGKTTEEKTGPQRYDLLHASSHSIKFITLTYFSQFSLSKFPGLQAIS